MGVGEAKRKIIQRLQQEAFVLQRSSEGDLIFVRDSDRAHLFERIELTFVGRKNEAVVLGMAVAAVRSIAADYAGLVEPGGLKDLCTDPENGRVEFSSSDEVLPWVERLAKLGPRSVREFAHRRGPELLRRTHAARIEAQQAYVQFVKPALSGGLDSVIESLTRQQRDIVTNVSTRPLVIDSEELRTEYEAAVAALVSSGDEDLLRLGQVSVPQARGHALIKQGKEVPRELMWRIRLLVDLILRKRADASLN